MYEDVMEQIIVDLVTQYEACKYKGVKISLAIGRRSIGKDSTISCGQRSLTSRMQGIDLDRSQ
jgi:hypothetical protein